MKLQLRLSLFSFDFLSSITDDCRNTLHVKTTVNKKRFKLNLTHTNAPEEIKITVVSARPAEMRL